MPKVTDREVAEIFADEAEQIELPGEDVSHAESFIAYQNGISQARILLASSSDQELAGLIVKNRGDVEKVISVQDPLGETTGADHLIEEAGVENLKPVHGKQFLIITNEVEPGALKTVYIGATEVGSELLGYGKDEYRIGDTPVTEEHYRWFIEELQEMTGSTGSYRRPQGEAFTKKE